MRQSTPAVPCARQKLLRTHRRHHRGRLRHSVTQGHRHTLGSRRVGERRPDRTASDENNPESTQPFRASLRREETLQLRRHERDHPTILPRCQRGPVAGLQWFPRPGKMLAARRRAAHTGHESTHVMRGQHIHRVDPPEPEVGAKAAHRRAQGPLIVTSEPHRSGGAARRNTQPSAPAAVGRIGPSQHFPDLGSPPRRPTEIGEKPSGAPAHRAAGLLQDPL